MVLRLKDKFEIDNLRDYSAETVEKLRGLLARGAPAQADPHRANYYELENGARVFYIHVSPASGKVLLLATWGKDQPAVISDRAAD